MTSRLDAVRARMDTHDLPALLVTKREHRYYLAGFSGSAGVLVVTPERRILITDFRYLLQVSDESPEWEVVKVERTVGETVRETLRDLGLPRVGFEPDDLTFTQYRDFGGDDADAPYRLTPSPNLVEGLRVVKTPDELALIRDAARVTDAAYAHLLTRVAPGVTECELALEAEWFMRCHGAEAAAFDIIVAAGARCALPHAQPGSRPLCRGDLVVVDMGARVRHYCADMTRTFAVGEATPTAAAIYDACLRGQLAGVAGIRAGMSGRDADAVVRAEIERAGYGESFGHGTGHGVGLEVHEAPRLNRTTEDMLPAGAVITIEPGIYLPELGGVRIEDLCVVTETGVEILTGTPKPSALPVYG